MEFTTNIQFSSKPFTVYINGESCYMEGNTVLAGICSAITNYLKRKESSMDGLYSKHIYWPDEVECIVEGTMQQKRSISPTQHCYTRMAERNINSGTYNAALNGEVIEAQIERGVLTHIITRLPDKIENGGDIYSAIELRTDDYGARVAIVKTMYRDTNREVPPSFFTQYVSGPKPWKNRKEKAQDADTAPTPAETAATKTTV